MIVIPFKSRRQIKFEYENDNDNDDDDEDEEEEDEKEEETQKEDGPIIDSNYSASEKAIKISFQKCPRCNTAIERISVCSHMTCQVCGCEFCYHCGRELIDTYFCECVYNQRQEIAIQNVEVSSISHEPMKFEKRIEYLRWMNSNINFNKHKKKYDRLFSETKKTKNNKSSIGMIGIPDSVLCMRNRIARVLLKHLDKTEIKNKTYKI